MNVITVAKRLYNVAWKRVNDTSLQFICEVACRSQLISGCFIIVNATSGVDNSNILLLNSSTVVKGSIEAIEPRLVTISFNNVDPNLEYGYFAYALEAAAIIRSSEIKGSIQPLNCKAYLKYHLIT